MGENSGRIRGGRPGFTLYFDQVDAIRRLAKTNPQQGLAFFFAIADYANDGTLPDDPFIDLALSGHVHQIESDCDRYWRQVDGGHEGGKRSAEKRREQAKQAAEAATADQQATAQPQKPQEEAIAWIDTQDGLKPIFPSTVNKFEHMILDSYDLENLAKYYADDVHNGKDYKPMGTQLAIASGFRDWLKSNSLLKHS